MTAIAGDVLRAFNLEDGTCLFSFCLPTEEHSYASEFCRIGAIAATSDGRRVVTADASGRFLRHWTLTGPGVLRVCEGAHRWFAALLPPTPGSRVLTAGAVDLRVWDTATGEIIHRHTLPPGRLLIGLYAAPDGRHVTFAADDFEARVETRGERSNRYEFRGNIWIETIDLETRAIKQRLRFRSKKMDVFSYPKLDKRRAALLPLTAPEQFALLSPGLGDWICDLRTGSARHADRSEIGAIASLVRQDAEVAAEQGDSEPAETETPWSDHAIVDVDRRRVTVRAHWDRLLVSEEGRETQREYQWPAGWVPGVSDASGGAVGTGRWGINGLVLPDGQHALLASGYDPMRIWDLASGRPVRSIGRLHLGECRAMATLPGGEGLLVAGDKGVLAQVNIGTGTVERSLAGPNPSPNALVAIPGRRLAATGEADGALRVWSLDQSGTSLPLDGPRGQVLEAVLLPEGHCRVLLLDGYGGQCWDFGCRGEAAIARGREPPPRPQARVMLPGGRHAVASGDNGLVVWDLESGETILRLSGRGSWFDALAALPDGTHVVSAGYDGTLRVWSVGPEPGLQKTIPGRGGWLGELQLLPGGDRAATITRTGERRVWHLASGEEVKDAEPDESLPLSTIQAAHGGTRVAALKRVGNLLVSVGSDRAICAWNIAQIRQTGRFEDDHAIGSVVITPCGRRIVATNDRGRVILFDRPGDV